MNDKRKLIWNRKYVLRGFMRGSRYFHPIFSIFKYDFSQWPSIIDLSQHLPFNMFYPQATGVHLEQGLLIPHLVPGICILSEVQTHPQCMSWTVTFANTHAHSRVIW